MSRTTPETESVSNGEYEKPLQEGGVLSRHRLTALPPASRLRLPHLKSAPLRLSLLQGSRVHCLTATLPFGRGLRPLASPQKRKGKRYFSGVGFSSSAHSSSHRTASARERKRLAKRKSSSRSISSLSTTKFKRGLVLCPMQEVTAFSLYPISLPHLTD